MTCKPKISGKKNCNLPKRADARWIFVPRYGSDGTENKFVNEAAVTKANLLAAINAAKILDMYQPTPLLQNFEPTRNEDIIEQFANQYQVVVQKGTKLFAAKFPFASEESLKGWQSFEKAKFGIFRIDADGNFKCLKNSAGEILPYPVYEGSFSAYSMDPTNTESGGIMMGGQWKRFKDSEEYAINVEDLDFDALNDVEIYELLVIEAAIDTTGTPPTATTFNFTLNPPLENLTASELTIKNPSGGAVTPDTVVDVNSDGSEYQVTFATFTAGVNTLQIELDGYAFVSSNRVLLGDTPLSVTIPA